MDNDVVLNMITAGLLLAILLVLSLSVRKHRDRYGR